MTCPCSRHNPQLVGQKAQQQTGSSLCREHDPLDPYSASASSMPSSGLQRKVTCCMYTACASAASEEGLQHSDVNKGLDMHTVTVRGATCNEHRARSPPRTAGTPADMTCKAEHKHLLLLGKVWQTSSVTLKFVKTMREKLREGPQFPGIPSTMIRTVN